MTEHKWLKTNNLTKTKGASIKETPSIKSLRNNGYSSVPS